MCSWTTTLRHFAQKYFQVQTKSQNQTSYSFPPRINSKETKDMVEEIMLEEPNVLHFTKDE